MSKLEKKLWIQVYVNTLKSKTSPYSPRNAADNAVEAFREKFSLKNTKA